MVTFTATSLKNTGLQRVEINGSASSSFYLCFVLKDQRHGAYSKHSQNLQLMQAIIQKTKLTLTQRNVLLSICNKLVKAKQFNKNIIYIEKFIAMIKLLSCVWNYMKTFLKKKRKT